MKRILAFDEELIPIGVIKLVAVRLDCRKGANGRYPGKETPQKLHDDLLLLWTLAVKISVFLLLLQDDVYRICVRPANFRKKLSINTRAIDLYAQTNRAV